MVIGLKEKIKTNITAHFNDRYFNDCCYFYDYVCEYLSNIPCNHTSETYVNSQSIYCIKLLFNL